MDMRRILGKIDYFTRPLKPWLLLRMLKSRLLHDQANRLDTLDISAGFACNMKCKHCSAQIMMSKEQDKLTLKDYRRLGTELDSLDVFRINITGGEPLLYPIEEIMAAIGTRARHVKIQTNGLLLDNKRVSSLKRAGANAVSMSLDSVSASKFDQFRGVSGGFNKVVSNIDLIRRHGLQVSLAAVVTHQGLQSGETEEIIKFSKKHGCHLLLNIAIAVGRWSEQDKFLFDEEGNDRKRLNELLRHPHVHTDHDSAGCPAGSRKIYITPYGDIILCPFIHVSFGNIKRERLVDIRSRMLKHYKYSGVPYCPAAENKDIYNNWLSKVWVADKLPLEYRYLEQ